MLIATDIECEWSARIFNLVTASQKSSKTSWRGQTACLLAKSHKLIAKKTSGQFGDCIPKQIHGFAKPFSDRYKVTRPRIFMVGWQKDGRNVQHAVTSSDRSASTSSLSEQFLLIEPILSTQPSTLFSPPKNSRNEATGKTFFKMKEHVGMESQKATKQGRILRNYHCYAFTDYHIPTFLDIFQPPTHHSPYMP